MIRLRPYRRDDLDRLASLLTDPRVMHRVGGAIRMDEVAGFLDRYLRAGDPRGLAARAAEDERGEYVGSGRLIRGEDGAPEIGYLVRPEHQGRGVGTAIARGLVAIAREEFGATTVHASVDVDHAASIRVLEKAGFVPVGTRRDENGEYLVYAHRG